MKIVFLNPHCDDFVTRPPHFYCLGRRALCKYAHLAGERKEIYFVVDYRASAFIPTWIFHLVPRILRICVVRLELIFWRRVNADWNLVEFDLRHGSNSKVVLFGFGYKSLNGSAQLSWLTLERFTTVIFHLSHYHVDMNIKAENAAALYKRHNGFFLAGDVDISANPVFRSVYGFYQRQIIICAFAVSDKYRMAECSAARDRKILLLGSYHLLHREPTMWRYANYMDNAGIVSLNSLRWKLRCCTGENVTNYISSYRDYSASAIKRIFGVGQRNYFAVNMVTEMARHQFCIVGEEEIGFPSITAYEALCMGLVLLGTANLYFDLPENIRARIVDVENIELVRKLERNLIDWAYIEPNDLMAIRKYFSPRETLGRFMHQLASVSETQI